MIIDSNIILNNLFGSSKEWRVLSWEKRALSDERWTMSNNYSAVREEIFEITPTSIQYPWYFATNSNNCHKWKWILILLLDSTFNSSKTNASTLQVLRTISSCRFEKWNDGNILEEKNLKMFAHKWKYKINCSHVSMSIASGVLEWSPRSKQYYPIWSFITLIVENKHNKVVSTHGKDGYMAKMSIARTTQWSYCSGWKWKARNIQHTLIQTPL